MKDEGFRNAVNMLVVEVEVLYWYNIAALQEQHLCYFKPSLNPLGDISCGVDSLLFVIAKTNMTYKYWKPECVGSFNMDWRILVFHPEPEAMNKIY
jgi:hypothetical protein